ncbi:MAG TPA: tetratricopeptide repeat protein, partial [Stellaceae bacterium]|nr:tetratricopeptide repeat protein [Stellaceae bacterium]
MAQQSDHPASPAPAAAAASAAASVGTDINGGQCRWEGRTDIPAERGAPQPANIFCGDAKRPTGSVTATLMPIGLPADPAARHKALERGAADTAIGRDDSGRMTCSAGQWIQAPDGTEMLLQPCALDDSEWPQVIVVAPIDKLLVRAEGLPSALSALEQAMAKIAGRNAAQVAAFGAPAAARDALVNLAGARWLKATPNDFDEYSELTETARVEASRKNFGASEGHYRRALAILSNVFGDQSPGVGLLVMELALQISNQERFDEAAALFRRASPIVQTNGTAADRARLLLYQAFDAANRGRFDEALEYADNSASTWRGVINQGGFDAGQVGADSAQPEQRGELAFSLDLAAEMALRTGNLAAADAAASEASDIITDTQGLPPWWR